jgi:hypothetical protein
MDLHLLRYIIKSILPKTLTLDHRHNVHDLPRRGTRPAIVYRQKRKQGGNNEDHKEVPTNDSHKRSDQSGI